MHINPLLPNDAIWRHDLVNSPYAYENLYEGFNTRHYTLVHGFCFFWLFLMGCKELKNNPLLMPRQHKPSCCENYAIMADNERPEGSNLQIPNRFLLCTAASSRLRTSLGPGAALAVAPSMCTCVVPSARTPRCWKDLVLRLKLRA